MKDKYLFVDAETDGLYGSILTVGIVAADSQGKEIERAYYGIAKEHMAVTDEWVKEHVVPILGEYESCIDETELLEKVWKFWLRYQEEAYVIADVTYPVECRLFEKCVNLDPENRKMMAPFPLMDLSSMIYAKGIEPLSDRSELAREINEQERHNALEDALASLMIWKKHIKGPDHEERFLNAKSIHVFGWPFQICNEKTAEFSGNLKQKGWKTKEMDYKKIQISGNDNSENANGAGISDLKNRFMLNQYLTESAKDIFIRSDKGICEILDYHFRDDDTYRYVIDCEKKQFRLPIRSIELHLYHFGVGILFIEVLNEDGQNFETDVQGITDSLAEIKLINEYGRRVMLPFLPSGKDGTILCAERLGIENSECGCYTDYRQIVRDLYEGVEEQSAISADVLSGRADFLYALLNHDLRDIKKPEIEIRPYTDDRMFVACCIRDDGLSEKIETYYKEDEEKKNLPFDVDQFEKDLYSILYVDAADASCQNKKMRQELFEKSLYTRWSDWGTLWGVTSYSMFCLTSADSGINDSVIRPFVMEYKYLVSLVLAQRLGISNFSTQAGDIVKGVEKKGPISYRKTKRLINLQEQYITFKNQLLILEVSCQEQGIEIYRKLQQQLLVAEEQQILDEQLESLYEVTNVSHGNFIGFLGLAIATVTFIKDVWPVIWEIIKGLFNGV